MTQHLRDQSTLRTAPEYVECFDCYFSQASLKIADGIVVSRLSKHTLPVEQEHPAEDGTYDGHQDDRAQRHHRDGEVLLEKKHRTLKSYTVQR